MVKFRLHSQDKQYSLGYKGVKGERKYLRGGQIYDSEEFKDNWESVKSQLGNNIAYIPAQDNKLNGSATNEKKE